MVESFVSVSYSDHSQTNWFMNGVKLRLGNCSNFNFWSDNLSGSYCFMQVFGTGTCLGDVHCCVGKNLIEQSYSLLQRTAQNAAVTTTSSDDFSITIRLVGSSYVP
ncbi:hypothetical protein TSUD_12640 [Trifolium subterraneum]|uniref:Uncharacterized protein n=1 Tax=Trifolium subterraneum TaxID=3900 RepID=A0A2Z6PW46_TRISU|nr:hypothetical protein TSUD_12640 [Trifolium subterraneum]